MKNKKILILSGGKVNLFAFSKCGKELGLDLKLASFSDLEYDFKTTDKKFVVKIGQEDLTNFNVIYFRVIGKRLEDASIVADYARTNGIKVVDKIYEKPKYSRLPFAKGLETKLLFEKGLPVPRTIFTSLAGLMEKAPKLLGFPFVIKGTTGKQGKAVWSPENQEELSKLIKMLEPRELIGERFIAQEFIEASIRIRVFVIGGKAKAAIVRPTHWRTRFDNGKPIKFSYRKVPVRYSLLAEKSAKSLSIDIAGVDILETKDKKLYVLEVNSAPRWDSIKKDTGLNVEKEILKYLINL